jgi:uncharacterized protein YerC
MAPIDDALAAIKSLEPGENFTYQAIADKYGVSRCTLSRRHRGCQHDANAKNQAQNKLNPQQEAELIQYVNDLTKKALPPTRDMIRNFASKIAAAPVGDSWVRRFLNRNTTNLVSKWTTSIDRTRYAANSKHKYEL